MSFLKDMLSKLFESGDDSDDEDMENSFEISQHMRIVIALMVVVISGFVLWWILE